MDIVLIVAIIAASLLAAGLSDSRSIAKHGRYTETDRLADRQRMREQRRG